jgi:hypothetical protein
VQALLSRGLQGGEWWVLKNAPCLPLRVFAPAELSQKQFHY